MRVTRTSTIVGLVAVAGAMLLGASCRLEADDDVAPETFEPPESPEEFIPPEPEVGTQELVILHTNDEHSHLLGFAPNSAYPFLPEADGTVDSNAVIGDLAASSDQETKSGIVRRQYLINEIREQTDAPVLVLSAGDVMMGTIFHAATTDFSPDYVSMAFLGYDFVTLGNHEFDFGPDALAAAIQKANEITFGSAVPIISSNIDFGDVEEGGSGAALEAMFGEGNSGAPIMPWATRELGNGLQVGIMAFTGYEASLVAPLRAPVSFSSPTSGSACDVDADCTGGEAGFSCVLGHCVDTLDATGHVAALIADVQSVVTMLREDEDVDVVIALSHSGTQEDVAVAQAVDGIDIIIGGHSHERIEPFVPEGTSTIITQAGWYGELLGELHVTIDLPEDETGDASVTLDSDASVIHAVDYTLDDDIFAGTDVGENPPVISDALTRALELTGGLLAPVYSGINDAFTPALTPLALSSLLDTAATSDHDIVGEIPFEDTHLMQLVTDAQRVTAIGGACLTPDPGNNDFIFSAQANGVIRESLVFGDQTNETTAADVFRVVPLGASPLEASPSPGYPLTVFELDGVSLYAATDVGVTVGLQSDAFFLSYSGMRITYDESLPPFDSEALLTGGDPGGRVTKIEMSDMAGGWITLFDASIGDTWGAHWQQGFNPMPQSGDHVTVITNLYIASLMGSFGVSPYHSELHPTSAGEPIEPIAALGSMGVVGQTVLCQVPSACPIDLCIIESGGTVPWALNEVKEWYALLSYIRTPAAQGGLGGDFATDEYGGTLDPRVIPTAQ